MGKENEMKPDEKVGNSVAAFANTKKAMAVILAIPKAELERRDKDWRKGRKKR